ncbi:MAG: hypothetical protein EBV86_16780 [Marivivens sp.]|nr:hypothetical protein [Marivivens sp.]
MSEIDVHSMIGVIGASIAHLFVQVFAILWIFATFLMAFQRLCLKLLMTLWIIDAPFSGPFNDALFVLLIVFLCSCARLWCSVLSLYALTIALVVVPTLLF